MKKFIFNLFIILFTLCISALAADLKFSPDGGGKFIYCNNNEFIRRDHLADANNPKPEYIMTNEDMGEGKYTLYFSHINHTELMEHPSPYADTGEIPKDLPEEERKKLEEIKEPGFAIEVDVRFKAKEDAVIKFTALGFEAQGMRDYYLTNRLVHYEDPWGCFGAVADYFKTPIYTIDSEYKYFPRQFNEKKITISKGEVFWLSEIIDNYSNVGWLKPVHLLCDFEIEKGITDINIAALRSGRVLKQRHALSENIGHGRYYRDGQYKGVATSLPSVTAELEYEIDDAVSDGEKLPVTIYNQFVPEGLTVYEWHTNINPQNDKNVRRSAAESDILGLTYKDKDKLNLYAKDAEEKSDVWLFDVYHSATRTDQKPNYVLDPSKSNVGKSVGLANYCVKNNYKLKIKNNGTKDRYFCYSAKCSADLICYVTDSEGKRQFPYLVSKGQSDGAEFKTLARVLLPKNEETEFTLTTFLPINFMGAILNSFTVESEEKSFNFYEDLKQGDKQDYYYTGKNYALFYKYGFLVSEDRKIAKMVDADEEVKKIFANDPDAWRIKHLGDKYLVFYGDFAEVPTYYSKQQLKVSQVYFLDEKFKLLKSIDFSQDFGDGFPFMYSYAGGKYYIRGGATRASADLENWEHMAFLDENRFMLPLDNLSGRILLPKEGGDFYISPDGGENYYKIEYTKNMKKPRFAEVMGDMYFYTEKNMLYASNDALFWQSFDAGEEIKRISREKEEFVINGKIRYSFPKTELKKQVVINDKLLLFDEGQIENPTDSLVLAERILKEKEIEYFYKKTYPQNKETLIIKHEGDEYELKASSNAVYKNGKKLFMNNSCRIKDGELYIPVKDVFTLLGFDIEYYENAKIIVIK